MSKYAKKSVVFGVFGLLLSVGFFFSLSNNPKRGVASVEGIEDSGQVKGFVVCGKGSYQREALLNLNKKLIPNKENHIFGAIAKDKNSIDRVLKLDVSDGIEISSPIMIDSLSTEWGLKYDTPSAVKKSNMFKYIYSQMRKDEKDLTRYELLQEILEKRFTACVSVSAD